MNRVLLDLAAEVAVSVPLLLLHLFFTGVGVVIFLSSLTVVLSLSIPHSRMLLWCIWVGVLQFPTLRHRVEDDLAKKSCFYSTEARSLGDRRLRYRPLFVPREFLGIKRFWKNRVFAELILKEGVALTHETTEEGQKVVLDVDLKEDCYGIYNTDGKWFVTSMMTRDNAAQRLSEQIERWFEDPKDSFPLELLDSPLRWTSCGAIPIVRWEGPDGDGEAWKKWGEWWMMSFFRPIRPAGHNVANGGSERESEYLYPEQVISREFREEVVLLSEPPIVNQTVYQRKMEIEGEETLKGFKEGMKILSFLQGEHLHGEHKRLRHDDDGITINLTDQGPVEVRYLRTQYSVRIRDRNKQLPLVQNVILSINPHEAGIELIRVFHFNLRNNIPVFGEVAEWGYLPRSPFVLLSLKYLKQLYAPARSLGKTAEGQKGDDIFAGGRLVGDKFPKGTVYLFKGDLEMSKSRRAHLEAEVGKKKRLRPSKAKELDYLQGSGRNIIPGYLEMLDDILRLSATPDGVIASNSTRPFFVLLPVTWKTLERALKDDVLGTLDPSLKVGPASAGNAPLPLRPVSGSG